MFRAICNIRVLPQTRKLLFLPAGSRCISTGIAAHCVRAPQGGSNRRVLDSLCCSNHSPPPLTAEESDGGSPEESVLDQDQLAKLYSGWFPTDFSGEAIYVRTTRNDFEKLATAFDSTREVRTSAVSLQFYEAFSKSAILRKPASVHERIIGLVRDELAHLLPRGEFRAVGNHSISPGLSDPDLQLLQSGKGKRIPKSIFAIEVGFSQPSEDLEERVKRLLRESTVKVAMLFDIKETPKYKNPFTINEPKNLRRTGNMSKTTDTKPTTAEIHIETYKSQRSQTDLESSLCLEDSRNPYSPVFIYGVRWVGELTGVVQVFAKDPVSGDVVARTKKTLFYGRQEVMDQQWKQRLKRPKKSQLQQDEEERPVYNAHPKLNIKLADFIPRPDDMYKQEFTLDWDFLRDELEESRLFLARERLLAAVEKLGKEGRL